MTTDMKTLNEIRSLTENYKTMKIYVGTFCLYGLLYNKIAITVLYGL